MKKFTANENNVAYIVYLAKVNDGTPTRHYFINKQWAIALYNRCEDYSFRQFCVEINIPDIYNFIEES